MTDDEILHELQSIKDGVPNVDFYSLFADDNEQYKKRNMQQLLSEVARSKYVDAYNALDDWLTWLIDLFDCKRIKDGTFIEYIEQQKVAEPAWWSLACRWADEVKGTKTGTSQRTGKGATLCWVDFFGQLYEEHFQSGHKASSLGQFFTPPDVSELCARLTHGNEEVPESIIIGDCCCGSGRMLLAGYSAYREQIDNDTHYHFFSAGDIDYTSVKMCALNLMMHGLQGLVVRQNSLTLDKPTCGYLINPTDFPVRSGMYSIMPLTADEAANLVDWQDVSSLGNVNYNANAYQEGRIRLWKWAKCVNDGKNNYENRNNDVKLDSDGKSSKPKRIVQLSLFD